MEIRKVGEEAYFVPSYSEQTILLYDSLVTSQTVMTEAREEDESKISSIEQEHDFTKKDFKQTLRKVSSSSEKIKSQIVRSHSY